MSDLTQLIDLFAGCRVLDLSRPYVIGMPQSPNHPQFWHSLPRRHGDMVRSDGGSAANDFITLGTHVGTHMDALAHVSHDGLLHGDVDAREASIGGRFTTLGIDEAAPILGRGILLDVPAALDLVTCEPAYEITVDDLDAALDLVDTALRPGDVLIVRSGWGQRWDDGQAYVGRDSGVPGVGEAGARWLAGQSPAAVGADTIAFEHLPAGRGHSVLPAHRVLLVDAGINIIETMALEDLAAVTSQTGTRTFPVVVVPLPLVGATGSPVRPLALLPGGRQP